MIARTRILMKFSDLLDEVRIFNQNSKAHLKDPKEFENDRQRIKRWADNYGIYLVLDE